MVKFAPPIASHAPSCVRHVPPMSPSQNSMLEVGAEEQYIGVGAGVGSIVGIDVGGEDGDKVTVGTAVGAGVGSVVGIGVGTVVGIVVGTPVDACTLTFISSSASRTCEDHASVEWPWNERADEAVVRTSGTSCVHHCTSVTLRAPEWPRVIAARAGAADLRSHTTSSGPRRCGQARFSVLLNDATVT